ncbi:MAG: hypothetical protein R3A45_03905 [Bdellovibrionota bacterium]
MEQMFTHEVAVDADNLPVYRFSRRTKGNTLLEKALNDEKDESHILYDLVASLTQKAQKF